jgi:hypothetical protein
VLAGLALSGCGLTVQSPDDFVLTRTGGSGRLTELVNDSGTISCNGGKARRMSSAMLIAARNLVTSLDADAKQGMRLPASGGSVYTYTIRMQDGTISFPDTAAARHPELGPAEQFALQAAEGPCAGH